MIPGQTSTPVAHWSITTTMTTASATCATAFLRAVDRLHGAQRAWEDTLIAVATADGWRDKFNATLASDEALRGIERAEADLSAAAVNLAAVYGVALAAMAAQARR